MADQTKDDEPKDERIERRRRAVALIGALHAKDDDKAEASKVASYVEKSLDSVSAFNRH